MPYRENEKADPSPGRSKKGIQSARSILGRLLFVSRDSRPDLAYSASFLGRRIARATNRTMDLLRRVAKFAANHPINISIPTSHSRTHIEIEAFVDASLGNDNDNHGQTGYIIFANGHPLLWRSKRQARVARSSAKAELLALHDISDTLEWLKQVYGRVEVQTNVTIHSDAKDVISLMRGDSKPREKADIIKIEELRKQLGGVAANPMQTLTIPHFSLHTWHSVKVCLGSCVPHDAKASFLRI